MDSLMIQYLTKRFLDGTENPISISYLTKLKAHLPDIADAIEFLDGLSILLLDKDLKNYINRRAVRVEEVVDMFKEKRGYPDHSRSMFRICLDLLGITRSYEQGSPCRYALKIPCFKDNCTTFWVGKLIDMLHENISKLLVTFNGYVDNQYDDISDKAKQLRNMLTYLKPLANYVTSPKSYTGKNLLVPLFDVLEKATRVIYLAVILKTHDPKAAFLGTSQLLEATDIEKMYLMILDIPPSVFPKSCLTATIPSKLYLLDNLIELLRVNLKLLNDGNPNCMLYEDLVSFRTLIINLNDNMRLKKLHYLEESIEDVFCNAIPIVYSCYMEEMTEDRRREFNSAAYDALKQIKHTMSELHNRKLYSYPKTDDLGFMELFLFYLGELLEDQHIPVLHKDIRALYYEVYSLMFFPNVTQEKHDEALWASIMQLLYEAEYVIDLYLASPNDSVLISSLSEIIGGVKNAREQISSGVGCKLLDCGGKSPLAQDVSTTSSYDLSPATLENDVVVGFEKEITSLMEYLVGGEKVLDVISIVGMAGIGKTTLAMSVFKASTAHHFDIKAWCVISQSYRRRELFQKILDQVNPLDNDIRELDDQALADRLCRCLKKRKYLIVVDDIWDVVVWNDLKQYLPDDSQGSRILITTRSEIVSTQAKIKVHSLHGLTTDQSYELLLKKMSQMGSLSTELLDIGKRIAETCRGLPLSIVIIAGLLSDVEKSEHKWNEIAQNVTSHIIADPEGNCKAILELSYNHLPNYLRSCFLYLGTFPEDREIPISRLKNLWIAEGFVRDTESKSSEDLAQEYLVDLTVRSLVIPAKERSQGGVKTVYLHDLLRDFCVEKAREENFMAVIDERNCSHPPQDPRRLSINCYMDEDISFSYHSIRSLLLFSQVDGTEIDRRIESYDMMLLKVLDIRELQLPPFCITRLIHLRYLAIWRMFENDSILLSSITKLKNLQVLIFEDSEIKFDRNAVVEVPHSIWDMMKLRYVRIGPRASFPINRERLENSISLLNNLRSLSKPLVSYGDLEWLRKLPNLRRLSCIFVDTSDAASMECNRFTAFHSDCQLTSLKVEYQKDFLMLRRFSDNLFSSSLLLPWCLKKLTLLSFKLFPEDMSRIGSTLPNLEVLKLYSCGGSSDIGDTWSVNDEDFPRLKTLKLRYLGFRKWTASENSFPCIEQLILDCCFSLDEIPVHFEDIPTLRYILVRNCKPSVVNLVRDIEYTQRFEALNAELKVDILIPRSY